MAARLTTYVVVGIVAATLIAGLIVGAQRDDYDGPVDLIVQNGRVFTGEASGTRAEAVAVRGNRVLRVGSNRDVNRLRRPQTIVVDAKGAAVLPGFNDSHVHFIAGGLTLENVDLRGAAALDEMLDRVRAWAEANADREWVLGRGWTHAAFGGESPSRQMLDAIVRERPVLLLSADGTAAWVNSRALDLAGIAARPADPPNGTIVRDVRSGEPSGLLKGTAVRLIAGLAPAPSRGERARALRSAVSEAHRNGITSVQSAADSEQDLELYDAARRAGDLKVRVSSTFSVSGPLTDEDLDRLDEVRRKYPDDPFFKTAALKISLDGGDVPAAPALTTHGTRAAADAEPAIASHDLNRMVRLADARGWQLMTHATGDRAVRMALDAYEHAARSNLPSATDRRHRIEHAENAAPADFPRFVRLGVVASVQPAAVARVDVRARAAGAERVGASAYRTLAAAGARVTFGSDWPAAPMNPLLGLQAAVARATAEDDPESGGMRTERLTLDSALEAYTSTPAWASFDDQRKGTLAPGMLADIVVLSDDIFEMPAAQLAAATVDVTIFDGKIVYRRGAASATD